MPIDYMDQPHEAQKHADVPAFIQDVAKGRPEVANAMWSFWNFAHVFDDLIDQSTWSEAAKELAHKALHDFVQDLLVNPFVRQNAQALEALFTMALTRNLDGDRMPQDNPCQKTVAAVTRCGDVDVLLMMAYLAGGWQELRKQTHMRRYDV